MKDLWNASQTEHTNMETLKNMVAEKSHPVLKKIKRQLLVEIVAWIVIICVYHNAFDGDKRPGAINLVFVIGFLQAIAYNLSSYLGARNLIQGVNLSASIKEYTKKLKKFQWAAVCSRAVLMAAIITFFCYGLEIDTKRLISIAVIAVLFGIQLVLISLSWNKRIKKLTGIAAALTR